MENGVPSFVIAAPQGANPSTCFDDHTELLKTIYASLGDGAATTDELRDVIQVLMALSDDMSRYALAQAGIARRGVGRVF